MPRAGLDSKLIEQQLDDQKKKKALAEQAAKLVDVRMQIKGFDAKAWLIETLKSKIPHPLSPPLPSSDVCAAANQYNYVDLWRAQAQAGIPSPFATVDHFWTMVKDGMLPMLGPAATDVTDEFGNVTSFSFASSEGDYGLAYKSPPNSENETIYRLALNGNAVVDGIWIRQLRISTVNCSKFGTLSQPSMPCFPAWDSDIEEKFYAKLSPIFPDDCCYANSNDTYGSEYKYLTADKTNFTTYRRGLNRYHGGGYIVHMNDPAAAGDYVQRLADNRWVDLKTRAVLTAFCVFNLNTQLFLCLHITVEVDNLGKFSLDQRYFTVNPDAYDLTKSSTYLKLGLQGFVAFWVLYYLFEEGKQMRELGFRAYFSEVWNCVDIVNLLLFLVAGYLQFQAVMLLRSMSADPYLVSTPKLLATADFTDSYTMINSVNALVMWFKIFKYISITKRLMRISKALGKAAPDVIAFLFVFCILFIGFGISGHLLFGNDMANFANVTITFLTLYRMMLGDWDYDGIMLSAPVMGPVWFILWVSCSAIVLLNFIVGVLGESYSDVCEEEEEEAARNPKLDVLDIVAVKAKQGIGMDVDLATLAGIEAKIDNADASGDGNVDMSELEAILGDDVKSAFPGKSPKEIFAMFDKDGNGVLDKAEMLAFKAHWKNAASKPGTPAAAPSGAVAAQNPGATDDGMVKQEEAVGVSSGQGCGGPGGFCCCRCGCPKGASNLGERRAMERVELTLLRLESIVKDQGRDNDDTDGSISLLQEDDDTIKGASTRMSQAASGVAAKKTTKRNSVAPL